MSTRKVITLGIITLTLGSAATAEAQKIYRTDGTGKIQRADLDGSNVENLYQGTDNRPLSVALDLRVQKLYWIETGMSAGGDIRRADLDGSNIEDVLSPLSPTFLAIDPWSEKIYWTYSFDFDSGVSRANLDGTNIEKLVYTSVDWPRGIALDIRNRKMYWALWSSSGEPDRIQRADMDGGNIEDVVNLGSSGPLGITLDLKRRKVYWASWAEGKIRRVNLDGSGAEDVVTGLNEPADVALEPRIAKIYWSVPKEGKIQRADLDGSNVEDVFTTVLDSPYGIALEVPPAIPTVSEWGLAAMGCVLLGVGIVIILPRRRACVCVVFLPLLIATDLIAQPAEVPAEVIPANVDSGLLSAMAAGSPEPIELFSHIVSVDGAPWIRLHFQEVRLADPSTNGSASFLRITSLEDGAMQTLDATGLARIRECLFYGVRSASRGLLFAATACFGRPSRQCQTRCRRPPLLGALTRLTSTCPC